MGWTGKAKEKGASGAMGNVNLILSLIVEGCSERIIRKRLSCDRLTTHRDDKPITDPHHRALHNSQPYQQNVLTYF